MTQEEFNAQFEKDHPLPEEVDPTKVNSLGWSYAGRGPSKAQAAENARIAQEVSKELAERTKLDALADRKALAWKRRQMLQRGKRY